jgi:hypothetical protein
LGFGGGGGDRTAATRSTTAYDANGGKGESRRANVVRSQFHFE